MAILQADSTAFAAMRYQRRGRCGNEKTAAEFFFRRRLLAGSLVLPAV
jgi:hypothetical protein